MIKSGEGKFYRLFKDDSRKQLSFHKKGYNNLDKLNIGTHDFKIIAFDYNQNSITIRGKIIIEESKSSSALAHSTTSIKFLNEKCVDCQFHQYEHGA